MALNVGKSVKMWPYRFKQAVGVTRSSTLETELRRFGIRKLPSNVTLLTCAAWGVILLLAGNQTIRLRKQQIDVRQTPGGVRLSHVAFRFVRPLGLGGVPSVGVDTGAAEQNLSFDKVPVGHFPEGWSAYMTHSGGVPQWQVIKDPATRGSAKVLAQLSDDATRSRFPLAIYREASIQDGTVSVSFKSIAGKIDQGAGLVWRYVDVDNYYVARANALEDNVVLYKVEKGARTPLTVKGAPPGSYGVDHKVTSGVWHRLSVSFHGEVITVSLDDEKLIDAEDGTFTGEGKTGVWTKADSIIYFRDYRIKNDSVRSGH